jgi:hypothetical protein
MGVALAGVRVFASGDANSIGYSYQYYGDNNKCYVSTNTAHAQLKLGDHWTAGVDMTLDAITAASRKDDKARIVDATTSATRAVSRPAGVLGSVDAITSASRTGEMRKEFGATLGFLYDFIKLFRNDPNNDDPTSFSASGINSVENDYTSRTISGAIAQDLFQRNTTAGLRYTISFDQYSPPARFLPPAGHESWDYFGDGRRITESASFSLTQGITTTTIGSLIFGYGRDRGYLDRPYYVIPVGDTGSVRDSLYQEHVPPEKENITAVVKLNQYIPILDGSSIQLDYRYYQDTWNIRSHTIGAQWYFRFLDKWLICPEYRFYCQTPAFFYKDIYHVPESYMTADLKYSPFIAHTVGGKISFEVRDFVKPSDSPYFALFPTSISIAFREYFRSGPTDPAVLDRHYSYYGSGARTSGGGEPGDGEADAGDRGDGGGGLFRGFNSYWLQTGIQFAF